MATDPKRGDQLRDLARSTNERAREIERDHDRRVDESYRERGIQTPTEHREEQFRRIDAEIAKGQRRR